MANVSKLLDIIYGANPSDDDLRAIIETLSERLPKPAAQQESEPVEPAKTTKSKAK